MIGIGLTMVLVGVVGMMSLPPRNARGEPNVVTLCCMSLVIGGAVLAILGAVWWLWERLA